MKQYETYKDSGAEWIGEVPDHWESIRMKFIGNLYSGLSGKKGDDFKRDDSKYNKNYIPFTNIANNAVIDPNKLDKVEIFENENQNNVQKNDLFFLMSSENYEDIGKTAILIEEIENTYLNSFCKGFRLVNQEEFDANFLNYLLAGDIYRKKISTEAKGFTRINLQMGKIENLAVIIPNSLKEQTQIANYLDYKTGLIDSIIAQKETLIKKLKEQRQAIINEAVTKGLNPDVKLKDSGIEWLGEIPEHWKVCKFRYKFDTTKGLTITKANLQEQGIPCVNYGEIHSRYGFELNPEVHNLKYVSEEYLETNKGSLLSKGDFVFADTSEDIEGAGNFTHLNSDIPTFAGYHTIIARLNDNSHFRFIAYFMDSSSYRSQIQNLVKGVKVYSITNKILKDTILFFPPKEEQKMIAEYIDIKVKKIFMSTEKLEKSIQKLKEYRQSLISEAVTGKVDVRDWEAPKS